MRFFSTKLFSPNAFLKKHNMNTELPLRCYKYLTGGWQNHVLQKYIRNIGYRFIETSVGEARCTGNFFS